MRSFLKKLRASVTALTAPSSTDRYKHPEAGVPIPGRR
jgi:hypothetical protein